MAEQFADAFKRYWAVIVTVAGLVFTSGAALYTVTNSIKEDLSDLKSDGRELRVIVLDNLSRLNEFAAVGPRYTLQDHIRYAENQSRIDAEHDHRITVLEQRLERRLNGPR